MSEPHLRLSKVHRHYGKDETFVRVLEAADLAVKGGELVAIVAPSGAGKSTLLHLSGLLERPQSGEIEIKGTPTSSLSERGRTLLRRTTIGYVYQFHHLLPEFTALENVSMPQLIAGKSHAVADKRSGRTFYTFLCAESDVTPAFPAEALARLREIKQTVDPNGVFRSNRPV